MARCPTCDQPVPGDAVEYRCTDCGKTERLSGFLDNESPECGCGGEMLPADMF